MFSHGNGAVANGPQGLNVGNRTQDNPNENAVDLVPESERSKVNKYKCTNAPGACCKVSVYPLASHNGLIVQMVPPKEPVDKRLGHVSADIVLVIDVSFSMNTLAPAPPSQAGEHLVEQTGLTVLDLTKHAALTIIESLGVEDRLSIVTFSTECKVLLELSPMSFDNKEIARQKVKNMRPESSTALWNGIQRGLEQFESKSDNSSGNVPAMMVLTDGMPTGVGSVPSNGWVSAMRRLGKLPAAIHTYGFGYSLEPGLLPSIAELGGGNYSFIPDSSMLGTVFIHAVANLQSTFARDAVLTITYPSNHDLKEMGAYNNDMEPLPMRSATAGLTDHKINLNTIHYGQSKQIYLKHSCSRKMLSQAMAHGLVEATLTFQHGVSLYVEKAVRDLNEAQPSPSEIAFHVSRAQVIDFLDKLFVFNDRDGFKPIKESLLPSSEDIEDLLDNLPANNVDHREKPLNRAIVQDLRGDNTSDGQIEMALRTSENESYWEKWGRHYLPSLMTAHAKQIRLSFNDPGTQFYGADSPLFLRRLDVLNDTFDKLPPPEPSGFVASSGDASSTYHHSFSMSAYNNREGGCFSGQTRVLLAFPGHISRYEEEKHTIAIKDLRSGMHVETLLGARKVRTVLRCHTDETLGRSMCTFPTGTGGRLWVTPWHPISLNSGQSWVFPENVYSSIMEAGFKEPVYTVQLQRVDGVDNAAAHTINVDGVWGATMGHGLIKTGKAAQEEDVRNHTFYGDYDIVAASLDALPRAADGVALSMSTARSPETGLSDGFIPFYGQEEPNEKLLPAYLRKETTIAAADIGDLQDSSHLVCAKY